MNLNQINYLNIGLMFLSAGFAFAYPFETFLFVYTVLGPLHYLTEISWLHERSYYTKGRYDFLFLVGATVLLTVANLKIIPGLPSHMAEWATYAALSAALVFVVFKTVSARWMMVVILASVGFFIAAAPWFGIAFGVFLPTLIHVFVFTACFVLAGALKSKSVSGYLSLGTFALISLSFFWVHPAHAGYEVGSYVSNNYGMVQENGSLTSPFLAVNYFFAKIFNFSGFALPSGDASAVNTYLYHNPIALALMSFIAFAYTYHYLNWFSKTSIIRWHEVSRKRLAAVAVIWLTSIALYAYNYAVGLRWLFFLSLAHVLLEFPLNQLTFIQIGRELGGRLFSQKSPMKVNR
jgi:hypothetical protein